VHVLTVLAAVGGALAVARRERGLLVPAAIYTSIVVLHAVVYMDWLYYYVKLPFLLLFAFYSLEAFHRWSRDRLPTPWLAGTPAAALMAWSVALTLQVLLPA
jgi:hypothetical protein